jgi:hypothetical protein
VDHEIVPAHRVLQATRQTLELLLDPIVLERRDPTAGVADGVMVVLASREDALEASASFREVDALHEPHLAQKVERAVDAGDAGVPSLAAQPLMNLVRGETAVLTRKKG